MKLYLLRHGIAVEPGAPGYANDAERPLTDEGRAKLRRVARAMKTMDLEFDCILSSPCLRARQTAEIIADRLGKGKLLKISDDLAPEANRESLIRHLAAMRPRPDSVLLVGHEPNLSSLAAFLLSGKPDISLNLKKGGLARLAVKTLRTGACATLDWLLTPKQMAVMNST